MIYKIIIKNSSITNNIKTLIINKLNILNCYNIDKINIICNENQKGLNIKFNFHYLKKMIKVEKIGKDIDILLSNCIEIIINQIEKIKSKRKTKNSRQNNKLLNDCFYDYDYKNNLNLLNDNLINYKFNIDDISKESICNNFIEREKLSFENACIKLELMGYDLFYYKDELTNEDNVLYKYEDKYCLSKI